MNYAEIITHLENLMLENYMINEVGTGEISDINYPKDGKSPDYPYAFINPINLNLNKNIRQLNINLIVMTQCIDNLENILKKQSDMIEIINNIYLGLLSSLNSPYIYIQDNFVLTPFKERFADLVVGASGQITITFIKDVNICDLPK